MDSKEITLFNGDNILKIEYKDGYFKITSIELEKSQRLKGKGKYTTNEISISEQDMETIFINFLDKKK